MPVCKIGASVPHAVEPSADARVQTRCYSGSGGQALPDQPGFSTLHGKHVTASMAEPMRMNVLHPDPIGRNGQLTGKRIGRHLRPGSDVKIHSSDLRSQ
jgi:hypothetical protein